MLPRPHDLPSSAKAQFRRGIVRDYGPGILIAVGLVIALCVAYVIDQRRRDGFLAFPVRHGTAEVVAITYVPGSRANPGVPPIYHLRIATKTATLQEQGDMQTVARVGDTVRVTYREDRQGDILVQSIDEVLTQARR